MFPFLTLVTCSWTKNETDLPLQSFHERVYHQYMTAIIHLYAVSVIPNEACEQMPAGNDGQGMGLSPTLGQRCWAAVPIFTHGYCNTAYYQLPLLSGSPTQVGV